MKQAKQKLDMALKLINSVDVMKIISFEDLCTLNKSLRFLTMMIRDKDKISNSNVLSFIQTTYNNIDNLYHRYSYLVSKETAFGVDQYVDTI